MMKQKIYSFPKLMKNFILLLLLFLFFSVFFFSNKTFAQTNETTTSFQNQGIIPAIDYNNQESPQSQFAKKVEDGTLALNDVPFVVIYWINWLNSLAASIAVVFLIYGGYQYMFSGVTDDKEDGKKTVLYAILGLCVTFFAWFAVNFAQTWVTLKLDVM